MIVVYAFLLVRVIVFPSISRLLPPAMLMCLPPAVAELLLMVSSFLGRSVFGSIFDFIGQAYIDNEAAGSELCLRVLFCIVPLVEIFLSLTMVMCLPPTVNESKSTPSLLLRRAGIESSFSFVGRTLTYDKAIGDVLSLGVPFQGCLKIHTLILLLYCFNPIVKISDGANSGRSIKIGSCDVTRSRT